MLCRFSWILSVCVSLSICACVDESFVAFTKVNHGDENNWVSFEVEGKGRELKLVVGQTGTGLVALNEYLNANLTKIVFVTLKVWGVDERESVTSTRDKIVQITFVGENVSPMKRTGALSMKPQIEELIGSCACTIAATEGDVTMLDVGKSLLASGGAHKPSFYAFGNGEQIVVADLTN
jgi:hypothetical protein